MSEKDLIEEYPIESALIKGHLGNTPSTILSIDHKLSEDAVKVSAKVVLHTSISCVELVVSRKKDFMSQERFKEVLLAHPEPEKVLEQMKDELLNNWLTGDIVKRKQQIIAQEIKKEQSPEIIPYNPDPGWLPVAILSQAYYHPESDYWQSRRKQVFAGKFDVDFSQGQIIIAHDICLVDFFITEQLKQCELKNFTQFYHSELTDCVPQLGRVQALRLTNEGKHKSEMPLTMFLWKNPK